MAQSQNAPKLVTVFGGSGFVGRHVVRALAERGYRVKVAVRRPDLAGFVRPYGTVGQVQPIQANLRYRDSIENAIKGSDAVINLVGILYPSGKQKFDAVHEFGARAVAESCRAQGITNLIHMSALGADKNSASEYAQSKAEGEAAVKDNVPEAIIVRPSIIFGPEDGFFNLFGKLAAISPALPLIGGGGTNFQPVYVGDVAEVIARATDGALEQGTTYELGGPRVASFKECLELMLKTIHRKRILFPVPFPLAKFKGAFLQLLPKPLLTVDQVTLLETDNIVSETAQTEGRTLEGLGINPQSMEAVLPTYLVQYRPYGQFSDKAEATKAS